MKQKAYVVIEAIDGKVAEVDVYPHTEEGRAEAWDGFKGYLAKDFGVDEADFPDPTEPIWIDGNCSLILTETGDEDGGDFVAQPADGTQILVDKS